MTSTATLTRDDFELLLVVSSDPERDDLSLDYQNLARGVVDGWDPTLEEAERIEATRQVREGDAFLILRLREAARERLRADDAAGP